MTYKQALREFRRAYFEKLLADCGHNVSQVARMSGVSRANIYKYCYRYGAHIVPYQERRTGQCS